MFYMDNGISDAPVLVAINDCIEELNRCLRWERHHEREHDEWLKDHPEGNSRMLEITAYWRRRRISLEVQLRDLREMIEI